jgi:tetratricopeptide (TPR) repeat protein
MNPLSLANNYKNDIVNSQNTPLLIELNKKDISQFALKSDKNSHAYFPFLVAQSIYDSQLATGSTNVIAIDGDSYSSDKRFYLLEALLDQLSGELKDIKNIATLKETLKAAASMATGGLLNEFVGSYLEKGVGYIFDEVGDRFSQLLVDTINEKINVSNVVISSIEGFIQDTTGDSLGDFIGQVSQHQLHLSALAKTELNTLSKSFAKSAKHDVFQLTFKILLAITLESPKLIYINNPHKLDENSLAIISLLLSYAKHHKDNDTHVGLSFVYTYSDDAFQPYTDVDDSLKSIQSLLDDQRRFAQRYAMLERPSSDIPKVAVKSSLFIGRENELKQLQTHYNQHENLTVSVVSGEPGIGKTALVKKHLKQIDQDNMITLTLLNEVGHSSSNTGLSSLEKSILDEAKRLTLLQGWKNKGTQALKDLANRDNAFKLIGALFSGADKVLSIAAAGHDRWAIDGDISSMKQGGFGDLDQPKNNHKEIQFSKLDKAIDTLLPLSMPNQPLVLFVDDGQWIDNQSSEYILTRLAKKVPLYIVMTVRPSDAATLLKHYAEQPALNAYRIALLKAIEIAGHQGIDCDINLTQVNQKSIHLTGFDKAALNELISLVIKGEPTQLNALADTLFTEIAGVDAAHINTLFAIESINMLCDEKLYSENNTTPLIVGQPLQINHDISNVSECIQQTFAILKQKYQDSLSHYQNSSGQNSFNLMAYAVLEERLHLLKLYFAEYGNAAVNTLLFSSLLGAPFSSNLVKKSLEALAETTEPLLLPLKHHLNQSESQIGLTPEHYAIIDEVYEILSRYPQANDKYHYRHGLLHIFLDNQLDYMLTHLLVSDTAKAIERVLTIIWAVIKLEQLQQPFYEKHQKMLTTEEYTSMVFFATAEQRILKKLFNQNAEQWAARYTDCLSDLASSYNAHNQLTEAIELGQASLAILKDLYQANPANWPNSYTGILSTLAKSYYQNNQLTEAIALYQKSLAILKDLYQANPEQWAGMYTSTLINLAASYKQHNQLAKAIALQQKCLAIRKDLYQANPEQLAGGYAGSLNNLAASYCQNNQLSEAIALEQECLAIRKDLYQANPERWAGDYTESLNSLSSSYYKHNQLSEAIALQQESLAIRKDLYQANPAQWAKAYTTSLNNLAMSYQQHNQLTEAIALEQESVAIRKDLYQANPEQWAGEYIDSLNNLAVSYYRSNQLPEANEFLQECLAIRKDLYQANPAQWAGGYTDSLNNLAVSYKQHNQLSEAIALEQECVAIRKDLYQANPAQWAEDYTTSLNNLASSYYQHNQLSEAIALEQESLAIRKDYYQANPAQWAEAYTTSLNNLASSYKQHNQLSEAIALEQESVAIRKDLYKANPEQWAGGYTTSLNNLASSYSKHNQLTEAIALEQESLAILKDLYQANPAQWAEDYTTSLNNLANNYEQHSRLKEAIALKQESVAILKDLFQVNSAQWGRIYTIIMHNLAMSYKQHNQLAEAIALQQVSLAILKDLYQANPVQWAEEYTSSLNNLAISYDDMEQDELAVKLFTESVDIIKGLYREDKHRWCESYKLALNGLASALARLKDFTLAQSYFKDYFDVMIIEDIDDIDNLDSFIYPIIKYYQVTLRLDDMCNLQKLNDYCDASIMILKNKFQDSYQQKIEIEYENYKTFQDSDDEFVKQRLTIFEMLFMK